MNLQREMEERMVAQLAQRKACEFAQAQAEARAKVAKKCDSCSHNEVCSIKGKYKALVEKLADPVKNFDPDESFEVAVKCRKYANKNVQYVPHYPYPAYYQQQPQYPVVTWYGSGSGTWYK